jgi:plastocyanin
MKKGLVAALTMCLAMTACNGGEAEPEATETATATSSPEETPSPPVALSGQVNDHGREDLSGKGAEVSFELELDDFYFEPTFIKVAPGATVKLESFNEGEAQHNFSIDSPAVDQTFDPEARRSFEVKLPSSGVVNFYCKFHRGQGMQGAFYFEEGATAATTTPASPTPTPTAGGSTSSGSTKKSGGSGTGGGGSQDSGGGTSDPGY